MRAVACDLLLCLGSPARLEPRRQQGRSLQIQRWDQSLPSHLGLKYHCLYRRHFLLQSQSRFRDRTVLLDQTLAGDVPNRQAQPSDAEQGPTYALWAPRLGEQRQQLVYAAKCAESPSCFE